MARAIRTLVLAAAVGGVASASDATAAGDRWPVWPTEVDHVAAPLRAMGPAAPHERRRVGAVQELDRFATDVIVEPVVSALDDSSPAVQREALRLCYEREMVDCVPTAASLWSKGHEQSVRIAALKVLALDPAPSRAALLFAALRDPSEHIRAAAADFLGWAPLRGDARKQGRAALVAKLSDVSAVVRRRAVESLGLMGRGDGTLAIARLLDDPEPTVRSSAAKALGHHADARSVPAVRRLVTGAGEPQVYKAGIQALARLPGKDVDATLLELFDSPPPGLSAPVVAEAIGRRPAPDDVLVDGLIARMREGQTSGSALRALLLLGRKAAPGLRRARARGLEPQLDLEVGRLLGALDPPRAVAEAEPPWPATQARAAWHTRIWEGPAPGRFEAALALSERWPSWVPDAVSAAVAPSGPLSTRRPWLLVAATAKAPIHADERTRARVLSWAYDARLGAADRCLAIHAYARVWSRRTRRRTARVLLGLAEARSSTVRACAVASLGPLADRIGNLESFLLDPAPAVRIAATLLLATRRRRAVDRATRARLSWLAQADPSAEVRAAAAWFATVRPRRADDRVHAIAVPREPGEPAGGRFIELALDGDHRLWVPAIAIGDTRIAIAPGIGGARAVEAAAIVGRP